MSCQMAAGGGLLILFLQVGVVFGASLLVLVENDLLMSCSHLFLFADTPKGILIGTPIGRYTYSNT